MLWAIIAIAVFGLVAIWPKRPRARTSAGKDVPRPLRGTWLVKEKQGKRLWQEELDERGLDPADLVPFGNGFLLPETECQHLKIVGTSGSGKSTAIKHILAAVERRPAQRCVIVDPDGGYARLFYRPERGDRILNPFDGRSVTWDLAGEISEDYDIRQLATALVPDMPGERGEWERYGQTLVAATIRALRLDGRLDPRTLWAVLSQEPTESFAQFVADTPAARFFEKDNERMLASIMSVASSACAGLEYLRPGSGDFSLSQYARSDDRAWLFITFKAKQIDALRNIIASWLRILIFSMLERPEGDSGTWLVIDELDALGRIAGLADALARIRKFGGRVLLAFQAIGQLYALYGLDLTGALLENCASSLILKCSSAGKQAGTSQFAAHLIGEREVVRTTRQTSETQGSSLQHGLKIAPGTNRSKVSGTNTAPVVEPAVLPSQIEAFENLRGYCHSHGMPFWSRCSIPLLTRDPAAEAFVPRGAQGACE